MRPSYTGSAFPPTSPRISPSLLQCVSRRSLPPPPRPSSHSPSSQHRAIPLSRARLRSPVRPLPHSNRFVSITPLDPNQECTKYTYSPVAKAFAAGQFPPVWTVANIIPGDTNALAKYQSIQSQIPNIPPNGIAPGSYTGNWSNWTYTAGDPNCWWSWGQCTTPKHGGLPPDTAAVPEVPSPFVSIGSCSYAPQPNTLGFAFDDGPNCTHNIFYNFLKQNNQIASTSPCLFISPSHPS